MKSPFQDIIPPEKRSIRNVSLNKQAPTPKKIHHKRSKKVKDEEESENISVTLNVESVTSEEQNDPWVYEPKEDLKLYSDESSHSKASRLMIWLVAVASVFVLFFAVSWLLSGATVKIGLKKVQVPVSGTMNLSLSPKDDEVGYSTIVLTDKASATLPATGQKQVNSYATGTIVIYNNYSGATQKLVAGTRFALSNGLIYKLDSAVTVPGKTSKNPGSVTAKVTAEKAGAEYNVGLSDFTIPGFKGDPRYNGFYARSKTEMVGGGSGTVATVDDTSKNAIIENLKAGLVTGLEDKVRKELPNTSVSLSGLENISFTVGEPTLQDDKAKIEVVGTIKLYAINANSLAKSLLGKAGIEALDSTNIMVNTSGATATSTEVGTSTLAVTFNGNATIEYQIDNAQFAKDIAGKSKDEVAKITSEKYKEITSISSEIRPFWRRNIPTDTSRIKLIEE